MEQLEFNQQVSQEHTKQMYLMSMNAELRETFKLCSKICIKQYDSDKLSYKEKVCLNACFVEKSQSSQQTAKVMAQYADALKDKRASPLI